MSTILTINGVAVSTPSKITVTKNPIWSSNAGRSSDGTFCGDIICYKYKLQIEWPPLSQSQSAALDAAVTSDAFFEVKFIDPGDASGNIKTISAYVGTPTYPVYSYVDGLPRYKGVGMDFIEQ